MLMKKKFLNRMNLILRAGILALVGGTMNACFTKYGIPYTPEPDLPVKYGPAPDTTVICMYGVTPAGEELEIPQEPSTEENE